ncbi:MAG: SDR family oxidoreductase [Patescibacteria group bacterium]|nr:SDR family oxidoreductase [Patescibacteria group bacterium]
MPKTYLLTGGTGFLGSLLSIELIKRGNEVIFLGRSKNNESFQERLEKILKSIEPDISLDKTKTIEIDLNKEQLGLAEEYIEGLINKVDAIWHLAANLSFKKEDRERIFTVNVQGLKNILNFAKYVKSPVYYTSTAYVHGQRPGIIFEEDLIRPKCFNNPYEESKFEAETMIKKWGQEKGNHFIIFRPSIFVERVGKLICRSGYYTIVYSLYRLKQKLGHNKKILFPFLYPKNVFLNLMPVDIAIEWMLKISSYSKALGKTFHITNPLPPSIENVIRETLKALYINMPVLRSPKWLVRLYFTLIYFISFFIKSLRKIAKTFYYYKYYMVEYNTYDMKNTKMFLGEDIISRFHFKSNFIQQLAKKFIKKLEKNNEKRIKN